MRKSSISSTSQPDRSAASAATRRVARKNRDDGGMTRCTGSSSWPFLSRPCVASAPLGSSCITIHVRRAPPRWTREASPAPRARQTWRAYHQRRAGSNDDHGLVPGDARLSPFGPTRDGRRREPRRVRLRGDRRPANCRERVVLDDLRCNGCHADARLRLRAGLGEGERLRIAGRADRDGVVAGHRAARWSTRSSSPCTTGVPASERRSEPGRADVERAPCVAIRRRTKRRGPRSLAARAACPCAGRGRHTPRYPIGVPAKPRDGEIRRRPRCGRRERGRPTLVGPVDERRARRRRGRSVSS